MNVTSPIDLSKDAYQKPHDEVQAILDWISHDPDLNNLGKQADRKMEDYRHRLIHEFMRANDIVKSAEHNARFALGQIQNIRRQDNKEDCLSGIFKNYITGSSRKESKDETTNKGQRLVAAASEVAADVYLGITGFRPDTLSR